MPGVKITVYAQSRDKRKANFADCVNEAAERTGYSAADVAIVLSHFFEAMSEKLVRGDMVYIPGFGLFCVRANADRRAKRKAYPAFYADRHLSAYVFREVKYTDAEQYHDAISKWRAMHRPSHNQNVHRNGRRVWSSNSDCAAPVVQFRKARERVRATMAKLGLNTC